MMIVVENGDVKDTLWLSKELQNQAYETMQKTLAKHEGEFSEADNIAITESILPARPAPGKRYEAQNYMLNWLDAWIKIFRSTRGTKNIPGAERLLGCFMSFEGVKDLTRRTWGPVGRLPDPAARHAIDDSEILQNENPMFESSASAPDDNGPGSPISDNTVSFADITAAATNNQSSTPKCKTDRALTGRDYEPRRDLSKPLIEASADFQKPEARGYSTGKHHEASSDVSPIIGGSVVGKPRHTTNKQSAPTSTELAVYQPPIVRAPSVQPLKQQSDLTAIEQNHTRVRISTAIDGSRKRAKSPAPYAEPNAKRTQSNTTASEQQAMHGDGPSRIRPSVQDSSNDAPVYYIPAGLTRRNEKGLLVDSRNGETNTHPNASHLAN